MLFVHGFEGSDLRIRFAQLCKRRNDLFVFLYRRAHRVVACTQCRRLRFKVFAVRLRHIDLCLKCGDVAAPDVRFQPFELGKDFFFDLPFLFVGQKFILRTRLGDRRPVLFGVVRRVRRQVRDQRVDVLHAHRREQLVELRLVLCKQRLVVGDKRLHRRVERVVACAQRTDRLCIRFGVFGHFRGGGGKGAKPFAPDLRFDIDESGNICDLRLVFGRQFIVRCTRSRDQFLIFGGVALCVIGQRRDLRLDFVRIAYEHHFADIECTRRYDRTVVRVEGSYVEFTYPADLFVVDKFNPPAVSRYNIAAYNISVRYTFARRSICHRPVYLERELIFRAIVDPNMHFIVRSDRYRADRHRHPSVNRSVKIYFQRTAVICICRFRRIGNTAACKPIALRLSQQLVKVQDRRFAVRIRDGDRRKVLQDRRVERIGILHQRTVVCIQRDVLRIQPFER